MNAKTAQKYNVTINFNVNFIISYWIHIAPNDVAPNPPPITRKPSKTQLINIKP